VKTKLVIMAFLALTAFVASGVAAPAIIDFASGTGTDTGTFTYAGGATPLMGMNILIGDVTGISTPSNNGVTDMITSGLLSFTTGDFVSLVGGVYTFGAGGSITITGTGPGCTTVGGCGGNMPDTTSGPTLLSGADVSATFNSNGTLNLAIINGTDTKDPSLVQFFGLPASIPGWDFSGTIHATGFTPVGMMGGFTANSSHSTDIQNTPVPEPASIILLGSILVGITTLLHRRRAKA
jgi:hypothetical protein